MSYRGIEDTHLTYFKLLDGMDIRAGGKACDTSFNDFVTAKYLAEKNVFDKVFTLTINNMIVQDKIEPLRCGPMIAQTIRRVRVDAHICLGGTFNYIPVHDVTHALHSSLNAGGMIYIAPYPDIYDSQGRDVLMMLSDQAQVAVKDKLVRWGVTIENSLTNLFMNVHKEEVICDSSVGEIISLLSAEHYKHQLFRSSAEYEKFFKGLSPDQKYYMSWNIIKGFRR